MVKDTLVIQNPTGLHTRPAKRVVAEAKRFVCDITIRRDEKEANLKSLLKLMKLGLSQHQSIELLCDGPDEQEALAHLKSYIQHLED
ncbi:MAG: HPr family phosphocarrier protein [Spirochaetia bacterium]|nr:HPr family phosphocarrier protein [Spirochaetia bacterium]MCF7942363.1 HPr family phosphocarrier protein [Spirochaetia bacterium]